MERKIGKKQNEKLESVKSLFVGLNWSAKFQHIFKDPHLIRKQHVFGAFHKQIFTSLHSVEVLPSHASLSSFFCFAMPINPFLRGRKLDSGSP